MRIRDTMFVTILEEVCNNEREKVYDYKHLLCELYAYGVAATSYIIGLFRKREV